MKTFPKIQAIDIKSSEFPIKLKEIPSPPKVLYCVGDTSLMHEESVAVVGSRKYTVYGKTVSTMIGRRLGECNVPVVSGLAYGIDAYAHVGAIDAGGKIIGVLASGIRKMGPKKNYELMMSGLDKGGLVISEYEPDEDAKPFTYPARNRIISGVANCLAVVEANFNSGALITAQHALEQGRRVYAVPGNITSQFSMGSNLLLRQGATPLIVIDDLVRETGRDPERIDIQKLELGESEQQIYDIICKYTGVRADTVATEIGKPVNYVTSIVTVMEVKGLLITTGGKIYLAN